jgi:hypothetical protein
MRSLTLSAASALALACLVSSAAANVYYADAIQGSDASGDGSIARPFRTLTRTLVTAISAGDIAVAFPGVYDPSIGETFPLIPAAGVKIYSLGGAELTIVDGGQTASAVLDLPDRNTVRGLTITGSQHNWWDGGLHFSDFASDIVVDSCVLTGNERGIWGFNSFNVTITSCVFAQNKNDAVSIFTTSNVTVLNNSFDDNLKGVIFDQCSAVVHENIITRSGLFGIDCSSNSSVDSDFNCFHANQQDYSSYCVPGPHDIYADPLYVSSTRGDLHVSAVSPVLDKGESGLPGLPDRDLDFQPFANGAAREIGADEIYARHLYIMGLPSPGREVAVSLIGNPFDAWVMLMSLGTGHFDTDFGTLLLGFPLYVVASGVTRRLASRPSPVCFPMIRSSSGSSSTSRRCREISSRTW